MQVRLEIMNFAVINVCTDIPAIVESIKENMQKIQKTIPITNCEIINENANYDKDVVIITSSKEKKMIYDPINNVSKLYVDKDEIRVYDLVYILLHMYCKILSNSRKYLVHSSALKYDDDKSILLVGEANSGKTSLAYNLMENYDMKLISNDFTLIGNHDGLLHSYIGTKLIEMRYGVVQNKFPNVYEQIKVDDEKSVWEKKIIINGYFDENKISKNDFSKITDIFQISMLEDAKTFISTKDYVDQRLYLYQQLANQIKGTYNLITGFDYPMPSTEDPEMLKRLDEDIKIALENTTVHMCKGSMDQLSRDLVRKIGR